VSPRKRDDRRYVGDSAIAFAIYCDECGLSAEAGRELAERIGGELENTADDREFQEGVSGAKL